MSVIARVSAIFTSVSDFCKDINPATLSGAIDILVIEHENGELTGSPFHVRFGKLQLLRAQERVVAVQINGHPVDLQMKVGDAGEAFFVVESEVTAPAHLSTSPIYHSTALPESDEEPISPLQQQNHTPEITITHIDDPPSAVVSSDTVNLKSCAITSPLAHRTGSQGPISPTAAAAAATQIISKKATHGQRMRSKRPRGLARASRNQAKGDAGHPATAPPGLGSPKSPHSKLCSGTQSPQSQPVLIASPASLRSTESSDDCSLLDSSEPSSCSEGVLASPSTSTITHSSISSPERTENSLKLLLPTKLGSTIVIKNDPDSNEKSLEYPALPLPEIDGSVKPEQSSSGFPSSVGAGTTDTVPCVDATLDFESVASSSALSAIMTEPQRNNAAVSNVATGKISGCEDDYEDDQSTHASRHFSDTEKDYRVFKDQRRAMASDTEVEYHESNSDRTTPRVWSWGWGKIPVKEKGSPLPPPANQVKPQAEQNENDSATLRAAGIKDTLTNAYISLCGLKPKIQVSEFVEKMIRHEQLVADPGILSSPSLVVRINGQYYSWAAAVPMVASIALFQLPLSCSTPTELGRDSKEKLSRWRSWWSRGTESEGSTSSMATAAMGTNNLTAVPIAGGREDSKPGKKAPGTHPAALGPGADHAQNPGTSALSQSSRNMTKTVRISNNSQLESQGALQTSPVSSVSMSMSMSMLSSPSSPQRWALNSEKSAKWSSSSSKKYYYHKALRLTSDQLKSLGLKLGCNIVTFTVHSSLQGAAQCRARIFLWKASEKIVISDIDGTITKSDALGHLFTMVGRDWTHSGVASLYTGIRRNGYQILYLSSRAIGQAEYTRNYLNKVEQGQFQLPEGPVFLSPDRLIAAFTREVILRRPEEFKIACLQDIKSLFAPVGRKPGSFSSPNESPKFYSIVKGTGNTCPFYAGFGNRSTDAYSYRAVGVPESRIFTINHNGEVRRELLEGYRATYFQLGDLVDHIFPPLGLRSNPAFNDWNYWRSDPHELTDSETEVESGNKGFTEEDDYDDEDEDFEDGDGDDDDDDDDDDEADADADGEEESDAEDFDLAAAASTSKSASSAKKDTKAKIDPRVTDLSVYPYY